MSTEGYYPIDVSDEQWDILAPLLPKPKWRPGGPGRKPLERRDVLNGIFYVNKIGCQWRMMAADLGNDHTIYGSFRRWRRQGLWARLMGRCATGNANAWGDWPTQDIGR